MFREGTEHFEKCVGPWSHVKMLSTKKQESKTKEN